MIKIRLENRAPTKERHRFNAAQRQAYTPEQTRRDTISIRRTMEAAMGGRPPASGPVGLKILAEVGSDDPEVHGQLAMKTPDLDNLEKIIKDAGNSLVFVDDKQVADVRKRRIYGAKTQVSIVIFFVDPEEKAMFEEKECA